MLQICEKDLNSSGWDPMVEFCVEYYKFRNMESSFKISLFFY